MRTVFAMTLGMLMVVQPLPPGRPAGVKPAQGLRTTEYYLIAVALVAAGGLGALIARDGSTSATATSP